MIATKVMRYLLGLHRRGAIIGLMAFVAFSSACTTNNGMKAIRLKPSGTADEKGGSSGGGSGGPRTSPDRSTISGWPKNVANYLSASVERFNDIFTLENQGAKVREYKDKQALPDGFTVFSGVSVSNEGGIFKVGFSFDSSQAIGMAGEYGTHLTSASTVTGSAFSAGLGHAIQLSFTKDEIKNRNKKENTDSSDFVVRAVCEGKKNECEELWLLAKANVAVKSETSAQGQTSVVSGVAIVATYRLEGSSYVLIGGTPVAFKASPEASLPQTLPTVTPISDSKTDGGTATLPVEPPVGSPVPSEPTAPGGTEGHPGTPAPTFPGGTATVPIYGALTASFGFDPQSTSQKESAVQQLVEGLTFSTSITQEIPDDASLAALPDVGNIGKISLRLLLKQGGKVDKAATEISADISGKAIKSTEPSSMEKVTLKQDFTGGRLEIEVGCQSRCGILYGLIRVYLGNEPNPVGASFISVQIKEGGIQEGPSKIIKADRSDAVLEQVPANVPTADTATGEAATTGGHAGTAKPSAPGGFSLPEALPAANSGTPSSPFMQNLHSLLEIEANAGVLRYHIANIERALELLQKSPKLPENVLMLAIFSVEGSNREGDPPINSITGNLLKERLTRLKSELTALETVLAKQKDATKGSINTATPADLEPLKQDSNELAMKERQRSDLEKQVVLLRSFAEKFVPAKTADERNALKNSLPKEFNIDLSGTDEAFFKRLIEKYQEIARGLFQNISESAAIKARLDFVTQQMKPAADVAVSGQDGATSIQEFSQKLEKAVGLKAKDAFYGYFIEQLRAHAGAPSPFIEFFGEAVWIAHTRGNEGEFVLKNVDGHIAALIKKKEEIQRQVQAALADLNKSTADPKELAFNGVPQMVQLQTSRDQAKSKLMTFIVSLANKALADNTTEESAQVKQIKAEALQALAPIFGIEPSKVSEVTPEQVKAKLLELITPYTDLTEQLELVRAKHDILQELKRRASAPAAAPARTATGTAPQDHSIQAVRDR